MVCIVDQRIENIDCYRECADHASVAFFDRRFIVSKTSSQSQLLGRVPFQTDRITVSVFVLQIQDNWPEWPGLSKVDGDLLATESNAGVRYHPSSAKVKQKIV